MSGFSNFDFNDLDSLSQAKRYYLGNENQHMARKRHYDIFGL